MTEPMKTDTYHFRSTFMTDQPISAARICKAGHDVASMAGVTVEKINAGAAGGWCVVYAQLDAPSLNAVQAWRMHLYVELEGERDADVSEIAGAINEEMWVNPLPTEDAAPVVQA